ncbi:hypothetical protein PG987_001147 [Apiospora arundinis]
MFLRSSTPLPPKCTYATVRVSTMSNKDEQGVWDTSDPAADPIFTPATSVNGQYGTWNGSNASDAPPNTTELPGLNPEPSKLPSCTHEPVKVPACTPAPTPEPSVAGGGHRIMTDNSWNDTVPWPGNTYMILEKATGRRITIIDGEILLVLPLEEQGGREAAPTAENTWFCAENQNYFGFLNTASGRYMGHNGFETIHAKAFGFRGWETFTARPHPEGGYHLLTPFWAEALKVLAVAEDGRHLVRRTHGGALWEFRKVQK